MIMNKEILYEILSSKSETLSSAEIESILNEELDKSPQEMDTDLVDLCLEALNTVDEKKLNNRKKKYRLSKILIAAALFAIIIGISIPVCAKYLNVNVPEGIVTFYNDCFNIDLSTEKKVDNISKQLIEDGLNDATLPDILFSKDIIIYDYSYEIDSSNACYDFYFENDSVKGYVTIKKFDDYSFFNGQSKVSSDFEDVEYLNQNGVSIIVFSKDDMSYINYLVDNIEYNIVLFSNYEVAYEIAKTI